jgi:hypothetical protein
MYLPQHPLPQHPLPNSLKRSTILPFLSIQQVSRIEIYGIFSKLFLNKNKLKKKTGRGF